MEALVFIFFVGFYISEVMCFDNTSYVVLVEQPWSSANEECLSWTGKGLLSMTETKRLLQKNQNANEAWFESKKEWHLLAEESHEPVLKLQCGGSGIDDKSALCGMLTDNGRKCSYVDCNRKASGYCTKRINDETSSIIPESWLLIIVSAICVFLVVLTFIISVFSIYHVRKKELSGQGSMAMNINVKSRGAHNDPKTAAAQNVIEIPGSSANPIEFSGNTLDDSTVKETSRKLFAEQEEKGDEKNKSEVELTEQTSSAQPTAADVHEYSAIPYDFARSYENAKRSSDGYELPQECPHSGGFTVRPAGDSYEALRMSCVQEEHLYK